MCSTNAEGGKSEGLLLGESNDGRVQSLPAGREVASTTVDRLTRGTAMPPRKTIRYRNLKAIGSIYHKYGAASRSGEQAVSAAVKALTRNIPPQGSWDTFCEVVGGILPDWEGDTEHVQQIKQKRGR